MVNVNQHKANYRLLGEKSMSLIIDDLPKPAIVIEKGVETNFGELREVSKGWKITNYMGGILIIIFNAISLVYTIINLLSGKIKLEVCDQT